MSKFLTKQSIRNAERSRAAFNSLPSHNEKGELLYTADQQDRWMEIDDEWQKYNLSEMTFDEMEKLIKRSVDNAAKRKRMGYASTAQLRLIERKTGKKQSRTMKSKEASEIIDKLMGK